MAADLTSARCGAGGRSAARRRRRRAPQRRARTGCASSLIYGAARRRCSSLAIVGVVVFASRSINPAPKWSAWKPSGGGLGAAKQIADHVAQTYHLPNGDQLVDVIAKAPSVSPASTHDPDPLRRDPRHEGPGRPDPSRSRRRTASCTRSAVSAPRARSRPASRRSQRGDARAPRDPRARAVHVQVRRRRQERRSRSCRRSRAAAPKYVVYLQKDDLAAAAEAAAGTTLARRCRCRRRSPRARRKTIDSVTERRGSTASASRRRSRATRSSCSHRRPNPDIS